MKKTLLLVLCILLVSAYVSAADGQQKDITKVVSLRFPGPPQVSGRADQTNYIYQTDSCSYLAQVKPYIDGGKVHDSATLAAFYEGMSKGMLKGAKGTVLRKESIEVGTLKAMKLEYVRGDEHSLPVTVCSHALLVNGQVIVYSFTAPTSRYDRMKGTKAKFLSSITFNKDSVLIQYHLKVQSDSAHLVSDSIIKKVDSLSHPALVQVPFMQSHAGSVIRMFGILILFSGVIYFFATLSRRKG